MYDPVECASAAALAARGMVGQEIGVSMDFKRVYMCSGVMILYAPQLKHGGMSDDGADGTAYYCRWGSINVCALVVYVG